MDQLLNSLPKTFLAIVVLVLGLLVIRIANPPYTVCDSQMEIFRDSQKLFLFPPEGSVNQPAPIKTYTDICKGDNSPGGCFELFRGLKKMIVDLDNIPRQCAETAGAEPAVQTWLWRSLKLMVQIAWGERAPASYMQRNGWFDASELTLYCDLKRHAVRIYGNEMFESWREETMKSMPEAAQMPREHQWQKSLLSTSCDLYR